MKKTLSLAALILITFSSNVFAEIYKRVDADGRITYSNIKTKGATRLEFDPDANTITNDHPISTSKSSNSSASNKRTPTPEGFPKVDKDTQNQRDGKRKDILQNELDSEKVALEEAKKAYAEGEAKPEIYKTANGATMRNVPKFQEKMKSLQDEVDSHENNIKLLQKEIDNLH
jgi:peptidoglycan hydrolase CwlO-like protein